MQFTKLKKRNKNDNNMKEGKEIKHKKSVKENT